MVLVLYRRGMKIGVVAGKIWGVVEEIVSFQRQIRHPSSLRIYLGTHELAGPVTASVHVYFAWKAVAS